ncbi:UNVERIFIED_CONTAM: hypothetical protein Sradi_0829200 [Sesamum radiatum]|uniref:Uncharacterized protein n=1 Tax=Sesamum radiatum TaxID=300843 RepID=A0AAW2VVQ3_SESRA
MEIPSNPTNKQNAVKTSGNTQALQVVTGMPLTSASGGSTPAASAPRIPPPGVVGPLDDPPGRHPPHKLSPVPRQTSFTSKPCPQAGIPLRN